jgi:hypothetical protein
MLFIVSLAGAPIVVTSFLRGRSRLAGIVALLAIAAGLTQLLLHRYRAKLALRVALAPKFLVMLLVAMSWRAFFAGSPVLGGISFAVMVLFFGWPMTAIVALLWRKRAAP